MLASSLRWFPQVTVTTSPLHRGEHEVSRKTIAQGMSECFRSPVCSCAPNARFWHTRPRVQRAPDIPCALCFEGKEKEFATLGRNQVARTRTHTLSSRRPCESRDPYVDGPRAARVFWSDRIACIHMSGLLVRLVTAGQDGFRDASSKHASDLL